MRRKPRELRSLPELCTLNVSTLGTQVNFYAKKSVIAPTELQRNERLWESGVEQVALPERKIFSFVNLTH